MTRDEAIAVIAARPPLAIVADCYDDDDQMSEAIASLGFEYPDVSYMTCDELRRHATTPR